MQPTLKLLLILLLGLWMGASIYFSFIAAPTIFQLAKKQTISRDQAGDLAEAMLRKYFRWGMVVLLFSGVIAVLLAFATGRPRWTQCAIIVLATLLVTAFSGIVWAPKVHQLRMERRAHHSEELDKHFRKMHGISMLLNLIAIVGTTSAFIVVVRPE